MRHPHPRDRTFFAVVCAVASIVCLAAACGIYSWSGGYRWSEAPLETLELSLATFLLVGPGALLGSVAIELARGPAARMARVVRSEEWGSLFPLALGSALCGLLALRVVAEVGELSRAPLAAKGGFALLAALAAGLAAGVVSSAFSLLRRGTARVLLSGDPLLAGAPLEFQLELPFAAGAVPEIEARLALVISGNSSADATMPSVETTLWSQAVVLRDWSPSGRRRCRAPVRFSLPAPDRALAWSSAHIWKLEARSVSMAPPFFATFSMPIAIADPVAEGIVRA